MNKPLFLPCAEIPPLPDGMTTFCRQGMDGTGWTAWNRYGSVEERVTEYIEKKEAERREFIEQRRREDEALLEKALERFKCVK